MMNDYVICFLLFAGGLGVLFSINKIVKLIFYRHQENKQERLFISKKTRERIENDRIKEIVRACSKQYISVLDLNSNAKIYRTNGVRLGNSEIYHIELDSKAKYDHYKFDDGLKEYVKENREIVEKTLYILEYNRKAIEDYNHKFAECIVDTDPVVYQDQGISTEEFVRQEKILTYEARNSFLSSLICTYCVECYVTYQSPQGKNKYKKSKKFREDEISNALLEIEAERKNQASENRRREKERSKVTPSIRYDVMKRDGFRCCLCGRTADSGIELEVDHIIPISKGGASDMDNLQTLCRDCNRGKGAKY